MSAQDLIDPKTWAAVGKELRGGAHKWWQKHREPILHLAKDDVVEIFEHLKRGRKLDAKMEIIAAMSRDEWRYYRDGTTERLRGIAAQRAAMLRALEELGFVSAKIIAKTLLGAVK